MCRVGVLLVGKKVIEKELMMVSGMDTNLDLWLVVMLSINDKNHKMDNQYHHHNQQNTIQSQNNENANLNMHNSIHI